MVAYLTHYYLRETGPFQSLTALSDEEALKIMEALCNDIAPYIEAQVWKHELLYNCL